MRFIYTLFVLSSILSSQVNAQEFSALVRDSQTRQPVPYATVQYGLNKGVITNDEGVFSFKAALKDDDSLSISSLGYISYSLAVKDLNNLKENTIYI